MVPIPIIGRAIRGLAVGGVVEKENIEVAVEIVVDEGSLGAVTSKSQAKLLRALRKGAVSVVDEELVAAPEAGHAVHRRNIDVQESVAVDVGHHSARRPVGDAFDTCALGHILKSKIAPIEIEAVGPHVGHEIDVRQIVAIHIPHGDAPAIIEIEIVDDVELGRVFDMVDEVDAGAGRVDGAKKGGLASNAASQEQQPDQESSAHASAHLEYLNGPAASRDDQCAAGPGRTNREDVTHVSLKVGCGARDRFESAVTETGEQGAAAFYHRPDLGFEGRVAPADVQIGHAVARGIEHGDAVDRSDLRLRR